ncbi:MAG: AAA family ATPase, partial [Rhodopirellula bahusiensis]
MSSPSDDAILQSIRLYREALQQTLDLFVESGKIAEGSYGWLAGSNEPEPTDNDNLPQQMADLHEGFAMKVFATMVPASTARNLEQRQLGRILLEHVWGESVQGSKLHEAIDWLITTAEGFSWYEVTRPFLELPSLRDRWGEVITAATRMAHLIAMVDGDDSSVERSRLQSMLDGLENAKQVAKSPTSVTAPTVTSESPTLDHQADLDNAREAISWLRTEAKR